MSHPEAVPPTAAADPTTPVATPPWLWRVVVADPDDRQRQALSGELSDAGFSVVAVADWSALLHVMAEGAVDMGVVDGAIADLTYLSERHSFSEYGPAGGDSWRHVPLIFTVDDGNDFDWRTYAGIDRADYVLKPVADGQLTQRVRTLALKVERLVNARKAADALRAGTRTISAAIRATNDPRTMTERLVRGVTEVFGVDMVYVVTFDDERAPELRLGWRNDEPALIPVAVGGLERAAKGLAARLWSQGWAVHLEDHEKTDVPSFYAELASWSSGQGARATVVVPVGEGDTAFGLIWVACSDAPRSWTPIEVSLLQHLAGDLAHGLVQGKLITGQQEVLRRMHQLDSAKSEFLATVNHELRTPLTSLTAYLDLLQEGVAGDLPDKARDMLGVVERNAFRLGQLIDDVLTISRIAANDPEINWAPVNLTDLVRRVFDGLRPTAQARGVRIEFSVEVPESVVEGDVFQLHKVIRNVADNAVKFTPAGGRIDVRIEEHAVDGEAATTTVKVADTGTGIPSAEIPELFATFFRGSHAKANAVAGSGLGLAIVRGLVDAHGGEVRVEPTPGGGTTVSIELPVSHPTACPKATALAPPRSAATEPADRPPRTARPHRQNASRGPQAAPTAVPAIINGPKG